MAATALFAFWGVSLAFTMTPGADWAYAIRAGTHRRVVPGVVGLVLGHIVVALAVAAGVGALVTGRPWVLSVLSIAGALYLVVLGGAGLIRCSRLAARDRVPSGAVSAPAQGAWAWLLRGWGISGLNPKVVLLIIAVLPQFVDRASAVPTGMQLLVLGAIHIGTVLAVYLGVGFGASVILAARPRAARIVDRVSAIVMVALGAVLIVVEVLR